MMPELAWKSPIFHPNISASGVVCLGGYGTLLGAESALDELCGMLWDMIRFENYDETARTTAKRRLGQKIRRSSACRSMTARSAIGWRPKNRSTISLPRLAPLSEPSKLASPRPSRDSGLPFRCERRRVPLLVLPQAPDVMFLGEVVETQVAAPQGAGADGEILFIE